MTLTEPNGTDRQRRMEDSPLGKARIAPRERAGGTGQMASAAARVALMYFGYAKVSVRGPVSGELYEFSRQDPVRQVDARDAVSMLKTRLFRRIR